MESVLLVGFNIATNNFPANTSFQINNNNNNNARGCIGSDCTALERKVALLKGMQK